MVTVSYIGDGVKVQGTLQVTQERQLKPCNERILVLLAELVVELVDLYGVVELVSWW